MAYPRQKLYDINYSGFVKELFLGRINDGKRPDFPQEFESLTGLSNALPLSRGRLGIYFAIKAFVKDEKKDVIMSPFTIFDVLNMIITAGGTPEFCDCESYTSPHLHPDTVRNLISDETAAVLVTHYHSANPYIKEIAAICREHDIALIEDCAISLGSNIDGIHVGGFGDVGVFSFGLFKFISTFFGGAVRFNSKEIREKCRDEMSFWPKMNIADLRSYFLKGVKLSILTKQTVFNILTFPLFRFGYMNDIEMIKNQAKNDPNSFLRKIFPEYFKKQPSDFQMREFVRQFTSIEKNRGKRLKTARVYHKSLSGVKGILIPKSPESWDSMLNFPIYVKDDRDSIVKSIMKEGFDVGSYFYNNCSELSCFAEFAKKLPNLEKYVKHLIVLPTYPEIPETYAENLADCVKKITDKV